jgi:NADPH-dependent glutamate synthase beta subunit-like oxidoreductase
VSELKPTDLRDPEYFHKVVDCQYACPAHTPVPEYIRLIAQERYDDAYMVNWESNVFPGILGRTCDRPCEPACRRGRVEEEPVAICRLKRVAADNKDSIIDRLPKIPQRKNGKKIALIGGGPASLTVARDLAPLGYQLDLYDDQPAGGGFMRSQIPSFRLPPTVLDEEVDYILDMGVHTHFKTYVDSLKSVLDKGYDAVFVGTGAPRGSNLDIPGREESSKHIHVGIEWLGSVAFEHIHKIGKRVLVLGGGNTAMDCCRTARRLGGEDVKVVVRSEFAKMKASPWEIEDAQAEDIPIINNHVPKEFVHEDGKLLGMKFDQVEVVYDASGKRTLVPTGERSSSKPTRSSSPLARIMPSRGSSAPSALNLASGICRRLTRAPFSQPIPKYFLAATPRLVPRTSSLRSRMVTRPRSPLTSFSRASLFDSARHRGSI